jgi:nucleoside-diphosphate-sugar epimerase
LEEPDQEEAGAIPCSPYAAAKWASSAYARMFHALYKTPVVLARLFMVYGPGQQDVHKLIPYVTLSALRQEAPKLSSGQRLVDWIYVEDVVDGLLSMAQAPDVEGRSIEIGSGVLVSVGTVAQEIVHIINPDIKPVFGHIPERPMEQERVANTEVTYAAIGWKAGTSLNEGLQNTVQWYREFSNNIDRAGA